MLGVAACVSDWNAAIHRPTYVSSVKYGSGAYVVDGDGDSVSVTQCFASDPDIDGDKRRWWTVDFGGLFKIVSVRIHLRVDCCGQCFKNDKERKKETNKEPAPFFSNLRRNNVGRHMQAQPAERSTS